MKHDIDRIEEEKTLFLIRLEQNNGNIYKSLKEADIKHSTFNKWKKEDSLFADRVEDLNQLATKWVESKMWECIDKGSEKMIQFYLKTKGDYVETKRIEAEVKGQVDVEAQLEEMASQLNEDF